MELKPPDKNTNKAMSSDNGYQPNPDEEHSKLTNDPFMSHSVKISLLRGEEKVETDIFLPGDFLTLEIANLGDWKSTVVLLKDPMNENRYKARRRGTIVLFGTKLQKTKRFGQWIFHIEAPLPNGETAFLEKSFQVVETLPESLQPIIEPTLEERGEILTEVPGIGPTYFKRLKNEGIIFFTDFVQYDLNRIKEISKAPISKVKSWFLYISKSLGMEEKITSDEVSSVQKEKSFLTDLPGIGKKTADKLNALNVHSIDELAHASMDELVEAFGKKAINFINSAREMLGLEKIQPPISQSSQTKEHSLADIKGIGPTYLKRLEDNGIHSVDELLKCNPEKLGEILKCNIKKASTILQNASSQPERTQLSSEDDPMEQLTKVPGIGPTYAKRLIERGISTYASILESDEIILKDITKASLKKIRQWKEYLSG